MEKSYILCAVVLMSMVLAFPAWAGAKGPGEAAHVENEGRSEGEAAAEVGQDAAKTPADLGITDPEYYLWQYVYRPGEAYSLTPAPDGNLKSSYPEDLPGIQEFLKGSDWIHKTEEQRFWLIYDRLSVGRHGNTGEAGQNGEMAYAFSVLNMGKGFCKNYAADIRRIAQFMGLEAVTYDHSYLSGWQWTEASIQRMERQWKRLFIQWILIPNTTGMSGNVSRAVSTNSSRSNGKKRKIGTQGCLREKSPGLSITESCIQTCQMRNYGHCIRIWIWIAE